VLCTCQHLSYFSDSLSSFWLEQPSFFSSLVSFFSCLKQVKGQRKPQPTRIERNPSSFLGTTDPPFMQSTLHQVIHFFFFFLFLIINPFSHFLHSYNHLFIVPACIYVYVFFCSIRWLPLQHMYVLEVCVHVNTYHESMST